MNIRDRLMSRASVAVMAAFAPKPEAGDTSKVGQPERVEDSAPSDRDDSDDIAGLSADEQAQYDAMKSGAGAPSDIEPAGPGDGDGAGAGDEEDESGEAAAAPAGDGLAADGEAAPAAGDKAPPKTISYGKYQRELQKANKARDDLQAQLDGARQETSKEREARVRLDERTKQLLEAISTKPAAPAPDAAAAAAATDPEPDQEADPIGHLQWQNRNLQKELRELSNGRQQDKRETAEQAEERQTYQAFEADLTRAAASDPTVADAFTHLRETRYRELGFIYAHIDINDPEQCKKLSEQDQIKLSDNIQRSFYNEQMMVTRQARAAGYSPAAVVVNLAKSRGFVAKAPEAPAAGDQPAPVAAAAAGGAPPARQVAPAAAGSVTDQLKAIREGQDSSRSLSDAGGSPGGEITPDRIANMSDDEWEEFYDAMPKKRLDRIMGKPATQ